MSVKIHGKICYTNDIGHRGLVQYFVRVGYLGLGIVSCSPERPVESHPLSAVRYFLFNTFAASLNIGGPSAPSANCSRDEDQLNMMFVNPCIIVQFIKKNTTRCNSVSKFYYSIFI